MYLHSWQLPDRQVPAGSDQIGQLVVREQGRAGGQPTQLSLQPICLLIIIINTKMNIQEEERESLINHDEPPAYPSLSYEGARSQNQSQSQGLAINPTAINASSISIPQSQVPHEIEHKVVYGDTLEGLSLEYSVPMSKIKQRNGLDGDALYHLKIIIIPNPQTIPQEKQRTEQTLIEQFCSTMDYSEKSEKTARYYLQQANWDMEEALKQYRDDLQWEKKHKHEFKSYPVETKNQNKQIQRFYQLQELKIKKKN